MTGQLHGDDCHAARGATSPSFEELLEANWEVAFRVAYLITGSGTDAEDVLQEAATKAWRAWARYDATRPFRPWFLTIVANHARNLRRSAWRRLRLATTLEIGARLEVHSPSADEVVSAKQEKASLLRALDQLAADCRDVLVCRYLLSLSEAETAAVLRIRPGTVKSRTARALEQLRRQL